MAITNNLSNNNNAQIKSQPQRTTIPELNPEELPENIYSAAKLVYQIRAKLAVAVKAREMLLCMEQHCSTAESQEFKEEILNSIRINLRENQDFIKVEMGALRNVVSTFRGAMFGHHKIVEKFLPRMEVRTYDSDIKKILDAAGVPVYDRDNYKVVKKSDGTISVYYGGLGPSIGDGYWHGHVVLSVNNGSYEKLFSRKPFASYRPSEIEEEDGIPSDSESESEEDNNAPYDFEGDYDDPIPSVFCDDDDDDDDDDGINRYYNGVM